MEGLLKRLRQRMADEAGVSLLIALMISIVVLALGGTWISVGTHSAVASSREALRDRARNAAEAAVNLAMSNLSADRNYTGQGLTASTGSVPFEFEMEVTKTSFDALDGTRLITATGYAPSKTAPRSVVRKLSQQVELVPIDGFRYALFAAPGGITADNRMTVNGDVYSKTNLTLSNNETINGDVTSLGDISTQNQSTIIGRVHAAGDATIRHTSTVINGDLMAGGDVLLSGHVKGSVQAGGSIDLDNALGQVDGSLSPNSSPPDPPDQDLPDYDWAASDLAPFVQHASPAAFQAYWDANKGNFSGQHRVHCAAPCATGIDLNSKWTASGNVTIVTDSTINLSREVTNSTGGKLTMAIISASTGTGASPAVAMSNSVVLPNINLLIYAPFGETNFSQLKSFSGSVYSNTIVVGQQFNLDWVPLEVAGFEWSLSSSTHYEIVAGPFRELPS